MQDYLKDLRSRLLAEQTRLIEEVGRLKHAMYIMYEEKLHDVEFRRTTPARDLVRLDMLDAFFNMHRARIAMDVQIYMEGLSTSDYEAIKSVHEPDAMLVYVAHCNEIDDVRFRQSVNASLLDRLDRIHSVVKSI